MDPNSDEFKIQEMLLKDPADVNEDLWKVLQQRVDRRRKCNIGLQVRMSVTTLFIYKSLGRLAKLMSPYSNKNAAKTR